MPKRATQDERRQSSRVDARLAVEVTAPGPDTGLHLLTESINIGTGGVYCSVRSEVPVMTRVDLNIQLPKFAAHKATQVLRCEGIVVRCQAARQGQVQGPRFDIACAFQNLSQDTRELINEFVLWRTLTLGGR